MNYEEQGRRIGALLDTKQLRYGNSFGECHKIFEVLYPRGIPVAQYHHVLFMARVLDKMFRLATGGPDQEDPVMDIAGYALLLATSRSADAPTNPG